MLSVRKIAQIDVLHDEGLSNREIAERIGRSPQVANNYLPNFDAYGKKEHTSRLSKLSNCEKLHIHHQALNSTKSGKQIGHELNLNVRPKKI